MLNVVCENKLKSVDYKSIALLVELQEHLLKFLYQKKKYFYLNLILFL